MLKQEHALYAKELAIVHNVEEQGVVIAVMDQDIEIDNTNINVDLAAQAEVENVLIVIMGIVRIVQVEELILHEAKFLAVLKQNKINGV